MFEEFSSNEYQPVKMLSKSQIVAVAFRDLTFVFRCARHHNIDQHSIGSGHRYHECCGVLITELSK